MLGTPDTGLGIVSYGVTLVLLGAGPENRAEQRPWLPLLTAAKVAIDALGGAYLFAEQVTKHRRVCSWCTIAAAASVTTVPLTLPEAIRAARSVLRRRRRPGGPW